MVNAKVWVIGTKVVGEPKYEDFKCIEEVIPACKDGDIIVAAEWVSVDPYQRYRIRATPVNGTVYGSQVAQVIESQNSKYPKGTYVVTYPGWRSHTHFSKDQLGSTSFASCVPLPDLGDCPRSTALGILGMPGNTAYFGFLDLCQPKTGDTVLVNGAAGAVGSAVVQIAKIKGCTVVAFAGSDTKVSHLKSLGADFAFNYKTSDVTKVLTEYVPRGIDCYFDNVGGEFTANVLPHMRDFGRISICGAISTYNDEKKSVGVVAMTSPYNEGTIISKQLRVEGFLVHRWQNRWFEGLSQLKQWVDQGKLKYKESVTNGFENIPLAFIGLFHGDNLGKAVVKV